MFGGNYVKIKKLPSYKPKDYQKYTIMLIASHGKVRTMEMTAITFRSYVAIGIVIFLLMFGSLFHYHYVVSNSAASIQENSFLKQENEKLTLQINQLNNKVNNMNIEINKMAKISETNKKLEGK